MHNIEVRFKAAIEEMRTTGNRDAFVEIGAILKSVVNELKANGNSDDIDQLAYNFDDYLDDIEASATLEKTPERLRTLPKHLTKRTISDSIDIVETTKALQAIECDFLAIAIKEETDEAKQAELSNRHKLLASRLDSQLNAIVIDNQFAKFIQSDKKVYDSVFWNSYGPGGVKDHPSPEEHMLGLLTHCIYKMPKDIDIPAGSEIVPISITINLLAPKKAIHTDFEIVEKAIMARRDELRKNRPELFIPEGKQAYVPGTRGFETEMELMRTGLTILQKSLDSGSTMLDLFDSQPPDEVILDYYNLDEIDMVEAGNNHAKWDSDRQTAKARLQEALVHLDNVKRNCFCVEQPR